MSSDTKLSKEEIRVRKAEKQVRAKMLNLVECLWTSSEEFESRVHERKSMEPKPATQVELVRKAATMLKKSYEYSRDVIVIGHDCEYHIRALNRYIENPLAMEGHRDFWHRMDKYESPYERDCKTFGTAWMSYRAMFRRPADAWAGGALSQPVARVEAKEGGSF